MDPRAQLIKRATQRTPLTQEGLPIGYYRADLVAPPPPPPPPPPNGCSQPAQLTASQEADLMDVAFVDLHFDEGFPAIPGGVPFWHHLDYEPPNAYNCFQVYLEQLESGPRALAFLIRNQEVRQNVLAQKEIEEGGGEEGGGEEGEGAHTLAVRARAEQNNDIVVHNCLTDWYYMFYWAQRAKAHDLFREAAYRQLRIRRATKCEDYHYQKAESLLEKCVEYMESPEFLEELTPKVAVDLFKTLIQVQRVSAGLPGTNPLTPQVEAAQGGQDFELVMRTVAQRNSVPNQGHLVNEAGVPLQDEAHEALRDMMSSSPSTTRLMQEMIIRISQSRQSQNSPAGNGGPQGFGGSHDPFVWGPSTTSKQVEGEVVAAVSGSTEEEEDGV